MKIFISQKMRDKTNEEILKERKAIEQKWFVFRYNEGIDSPNYEVIQSYKPELKSKDPITSLSQSLAMLAEADIVLVPKRALVEAEISQEVGVRIDEDGLCIDNRFGGEYVKEHLKGCEFEFLIALSYGKKVYTYDDKYNFEEV